MANGDIHKLGTLYVKNTKKPFPTKPWTPDGTPTGASSVGNILNYDSGNIEIRDTDSDDAYKLRWVEVNDGDKKLLISDRCILAGVSWNELNEKGLANGKQITIDGRPYKIRLLSGGTDVRNSSEYNGATPKTNEWDRIIVNESSFSGLPTPTSSDLNNTQNATDLNSVHNKIWNWYGMYSWCEEAYSGNTTYRVIRGYNSARYMYRDYTYYNSGWRPVLEVLSSAPTISCENENLGDFTQPLIYQYTISDSDTDKLNVTERLNSEVIKTLSNQDSNTTITLDLSQQWESISYGKHTIEIIVTDEFGSSNKVLTFNKIRELIKPLPTTSTLNEFIEHINEFNGDIDYIKFILSHNLKNKGVECSETDKLLSLVNKVNELPNINTI